MRRLTSELIALLGAINIALMGRLTWLAACEWWHRNRRSQLGWAGIALTWTLASVVATIRFAGVPLRVGRPVWINAAVLGLLALSALSAVDAMTTSTNNKRREDRRHDRTRR